jgi:NADPH:quinone reductase-like Zn-dependent oxidoreductase
MRALLAHDYGPPSQLVLGEAPRPQPGPGQVLVRVSAAALNPFDLKLITGALREMAPIQFPYVPGMDGAGTVIELGEGVAGVALGDEVLGFFGRTPGTLAELAILDVETYLARRPPGLDAVHAAALGESGATANTLLRAIEPQTGQSVLVIGATGGIGMFVVQLARAAGCEVLATATPQEADYVLGLGASHALDYTSGEVAELALALHPNGVDAVIDLVNSGEQVLGSARALRPGGRFASPLGGPEDIDLGPSGPRPAHRIRASYVSLTLLPGDLEDLASRAASGELRIEVSRVYPFADAIQAFSDFAAAHTRGKLVVDLGAG